MKPKVYFYPSSRDPSLHERDGYIDCVPFSPHGIERWIEPMDDPDQAQLFYCGQFHDKDAWKLNPNKFEFFQGRESKHAFDIEGDWRGMDIPEWLRPCLLTAMNVPERNREWNIMARPGCSKLLVYLARESIEKSFFMPPKRQLWFRGQKDSRGLRERIIRIIERSGLSAETILNPLWGAQMQLDSSQTRDYQNNMCKSAFILCPAGEGQATLRMYEACYHGRIPILIADCLWAWEDVTDISFAFKIMPSMSDEEIAKMLASIFATSDSELEDRCRMAALYFEHVVRAYFRDPTLFLLTWLSKKRLM